MSQFGRRKNHSSTLTAQMLGKIPAPDLSRVNLNEDIRILQWGHREDHSDVQQPTRIAWTTFLHKADDTVFDSGKVVDIHYSCDTEIGNGKKKLCFDPEDPLPNVFLRDEIIPRIGIDSLPSISHFNMKILMQSISLTPIQRPDIQYSPVPSTLTLRRVTISCLKRIRTLDSTTVTLVTALDDDEDKLYAFKHHFISACDDDMDGFLAGKDRLLVQLERHADIDSPFILKPTAIVTDTTDKLFRGYLMPFMPAGDLSGVLSNLHTDEDEIVLTSKDNDDNSDKPLPLGPVKLSWTIKHTWAIEIATAVAALHEKYGFCNDIHTRHFLLDPSGHVQLIDMYIGLPHGYVREHASPEMAGSGVYKPEAGDAFALGLVLWQIAAEFGRFEMEDETLPSLVWRRSDGDNDDAGPDWYRSLVESCIHENPGKRPNAKEVLSVLENERSKK